MYGPWLSVCMTVDLLLMGRVCTEFNEERNSSVLLPPKNLL